MLIGIGVGLAGVGGLTEWWALMIALVFFPARALVVAPIPYKSFKPYGDRPWWQNVVIFGVLPLMLAVVALALALIFGVGT
jgi:hypothetical protein